MDNEKNEELIKLIAEALGANNPEEIKHVKDTLQRHVGKTIHTGVMVGLKEAQTVINQFFDRLEERGATASRSTINAFLEEYISQSEKAFDKKYLKPQ